MMKICIQKLKINGQAKAPTVKQKVFYSYFYLKYYRFKAC